MTTARRLVLRPSSVETTATPRQVATIERQQAKLVKERESLDRWMKRLKRAFHAIESSSSGFHGWNDDWQPCGSARQI